jgi:hypothetical protein
MAGIETLPSIRKTGKYTEDPIKNLPQFPEKRTKQTWADQNNSLKFPIDPKQNEAGQNSFDLIKEINARDPKKFRLDDIKAKKTSKISAVENTAKKLGFPQAKPRGLSSLDSRYHNARRKQGSSFGP